MIDELKFVRGVVKKNKISPELEHYRIANGRVTGFNGYLALSSPIDIDFEAFPHAVTFSKAVEDCSGSTSLGMTPAGRLAVKSEGFRAYVKCLEDVAFPVEPQGQEYEVPKNFVEDVNLLYPFIADDASRPWAMGMLINEGVYMVTNNVIFVQKWSGHQLPRLNIPRFTLQELIRVGESPEKIQTDGNSVTFVYGSGRWIRSQLYTDQWPFEKINTVLDRPSNPIPLPDGFANAVDTIRPFAEDKAAGVYFGEGVISTTTEDEEGIHIDLPGIPAGPIFSIRQLELLPKVATSIDWLAHPDPCLFFGDNLRGVVVGRVH